ncbi:MAG: putative porin [Woeseiaceae bacterium]|nr:putative porin [Woeseiaceae bacterium]
MKKTTSVLAALSIAVTFSPAEVSAEALTDRVNLKGDFRLRYEGIDEQGQESRDRFRYRARFGVEAEVQDDVDVILELSTGADNPVSANTTIDGGFNKDEFRINLAYVKWAASDSVTVLAGKMKNPMFRPGKSQLIFDNDLTPEGASVVFESGNLFGNASVFAVEERSSEDDSFLYSVQGGAKVDVSDDASVTFGAGYLVYTNTVGFTPFFNGSSKSNSVDTDGNYIYDYKNVELFAQFDTQVGDWPLQLYTHWTENSDPDEENTAYAFGGKLGSAKKKGTMQFIYTYQDVEADAVIGTFNDSNFGSSGTDADGHIVRYKYALTDKATLGGSLFVNSIDRFQDVEKDYDRIQIDIEFKFN